MKLLTSLYTRLIEGLATLAGLMIAGTCLLIVYDVIARNLGLQPPASTVALTEYALLYFTMAASPWLVRTRGHIVVEVLHSRLGPGALQRVNRFVLGLCIVVAALISGLAIALAVEAYQLQEVEIRSLSMPRIWLFVPIALGFGLMTTEFIRLALRGEAVSDSGLKSEAL